MITISTARDDQFIDVSPLKSVQMKRWEEGAWTAATLNAGYTKNDENRAIPFIDFPVQKGDYWVYVQCQGFQVVKEAVGYNKGTMLGFIAYDNSREGWYINSSTGGKLSSFRESTYVVKPGESLHVNGKTFGTTLYCEWDYLASFQLSMPSDGSFTIRAPTVEKEDPYNFVVSYSAYSNKTMELGSLTITLNPTTPTSTAYRVAERDKLFDLMEKENSYNPTFAPVVKPVPLVKAKDANTPLVTENNQNPAEPEKEESSDSDEPIDAPDVSIRGTRLLPAMLDIESAGGQDVWASVRQFKENASKPPKSPSSVGSGSLSGGSLRGTLRPASEPVRETPYERDENKATRRQKSRFSFGGGRS